MEFYYVVEVVLHYFKKMMSSARTLNKENRETNLVKDVFMYDCTCLPLHWLQALSVMFRASLSLCVSSWVLVNLLVHLHQSSSLFKISPACLLVCLIYFILSGCQLICHFKDLSCSMLICLHADASAYLPVNFNVFAVFWQHFHFISPFLLPSETSMLQFFPLPYSPSLQVLVLKMGKTGTSAPTLVICVLVVLLFFLGCFCVTIVSSY